MSRYRKLLSDTLLFGISNFASKFLTFLLLPLYTGVLTTSEYGTIDAIFTVISLTTPIFTFCIYDGAIRFGLDKKYDNRQVLSVSIFITLIGNVIAIIVGIIFACVLEIDVNIFVLIFFLFFTNSLYLLLTQFIRGINKIKVYAVIGVILTFLTIFFNILFLLVFEFGVLGYMLAYICSYSICIIIVYWICDIKVYISLKLDFMVMKEMMRYSMPLIPNTISWWINYSLDKYMIIYYVGLAENGLYSVAAKIPSIITTITDVFFKAWQVNASLEYGASYQNLYYKQVFAYFIKILTLVSSLILLSIKFLSNVLLSSSFYESWEMMPFLILSVFFSAISGFIGSLYTASKNTSILFTSTLIGATFNIFFNILLIPLYGGVGAAFSTALSFAVIAVYRIFKLNDFKDLKLFDYRIVIGIGILIAQVIATMLNANFLLRLSFVFVLFILYFQFIRSNVKIVVDKIIHWKTKRESKDVS